MRGAVAAASLQVIHEVDYPAYRNGSKGWVTHHLVVCRTLPRRSGRPRGMATPQVTPYGSWKWPITSEAIVRGSIGLGQLALDGDDVLFAEIRLAEKGRSVLVRTQRENTNIDVTPPDFNVRTRVHEYGGGDYAVHAGVVYFSQFSDQRVYRQEHGDRPRPITPEAELRFADFRPDVKRGRLICVREDKRGAPSHEDISTIVALDESGDAAGGRVLVQGNDFYASPRVSPDGSQLCWLTWNHPDMPWDAAELWMASFSEDGGLGEPVHIAGGPGESIFQPEWSPDGTLFFISDRTNFWNLYRVRGGVIESVAPRDADFGVPQWLFNLSTYAFLSHDVILCTFTERGEWRLAKIHLTRGELEELRTPYTWFSGLRANGRRAVLLAGSPTEPSTIVALDPSSSDLQVIRRSTHLGFDAGYLSIPEAVEFPTEGGLTAHAFLYRPQNRDHTAPEGTRPPLIVKSHGGPTGATSSLFSLAIQYWTSRGFAVLDVNYGGSTGYGRAYRERLKGKWGIVDVDDCVNGARYLVSRGEVDGDRLAITGGSAGGYTTLSALTFRNVFRAGASYYGISDLERLAEDGRTGNHKFESRYEVGLVAPYPETSRRLPRALAHSLCRAAFMPRHLLPRNGRSRRAPQPSRTDGRGAARQTAAGGVPPFRGGRARVSARRKHQARARCRALFLRARIWVPARRSDRPGPKSRTYSGWRGWAGCSGGRGGNLGYLLFRGRGRMRPWCRFASFASGTFVDRPRPRASCASWSRRGGCPVRFTSRAQGRVLGTLVTRRRART